MNPAIKGIILNPAVQVPDSGRIRNLCRNSFQDTFKSLISHVDNQLKEADLNIENFAIGKQPNIHEVMIATEKADISLRFLLQIRNKLLDAYQEIMRINF